MSSGRRGKQWEDISPPGSPIEIWRSPKLYQVDGMTYDRTTAVLDVVAKPGLDFWKKKHGFDKAAQLLKEAAELGKAVHAIVEDIAQGVDPWKRVEGTDLEPYYRAYSEWHYANVRTVIYVEKTLWSDEHRYAGSLDQFAELKDGRLALLDVKTSRWASPTWRIQTIAYQGAMLEQELTPYVDTRQIIHLSSKDVGTLKVREYGPELDAREWQVWLSVLETYRFFMVDQVNDWKAA